MAIYDWEKALSSLGSKPTYTSKYQQQLDSLMGTISSRPEFSYDFNADPLYQQYKDQYTKMGTEVAQNVAANASALTGGFGNSYAVTAASQAGQQYLTQLNGIIPQLAQAAQDKYQMETDNLYNQYNMYGNAEDRAYGQYRDAVSDWLTDRDYYTNGYFSDRDFEYQKSRDAVSDAQWQKSFDYTAGRDAVEDARYAAAQASAKRAAGGTASKASSSGTAGASSSDYTNYLNRALSYMHASTPSQDVAQQYIDSLYTKGLISEGQWKSLKNATH